MLLIGIVWGISLRLDKGGKSVTPRNPNRHPNGLILHTPSISYLTDPNSTRIIIFLTSPSNLPPRELRSFCKRGALGDYRLAMCPTFCPRVTHRRKRRSTRGSNPKRPSDYYRGTIIFAINIDYAIMNFKGWLKNPGPTYSAGRLPAIFNREL